MDCTSRIFSPYRGLGLVSNGVKIFQKYAKSEKETYIYTVVGSAFHAYSSSKLRIVGVSKLHPKPITCIAGAGIYTYASSGNYIYCWKRVTELANRYGPHNGEIHQMILLGSMLISVDEENVLRVFEVESEEVYLEIDFPSKSPISCIYHPVGYTDKILIGTSKGDLHIFNLKTAKMIYSFKSLNSKITVIEQAPAMHTVAIGLENGHILVRNLKFDETLLEFQQDWGTVTSISFRTDNQPFMITGSEKGHIALWNLDERRISSQLESAHTEPVTGLECLPNEQLMVTSSADNSLKMWIFDLPDGGARLYKMRDGHSAPPLVARFYGANGDNILTSGEDCSVRMFSTITDILSKSLGRAVLNKKALKRTHFDLIKMPPIIAFTSETTQVKPWDNVAALHRNYTTASTWSVKQSKMGEHRLVHKRFKNKPLRGTAATAIESTVCGNFIIIGYDSGHMDKFNIQSGLHRGSFGDPVAHDDTITGIVSDALNQYIVSGDQRGTLKMWKLKDHSLLKIPIQLEKGLHKMVLQRDSGLIGCALEDWTIVVLDIDTFGIIRRLEGHIDQITDITFSPDARWLISSADDRTIRTWDLPSGKCVDCLLMPVAASSVTMSPKGDFLATVHAGHLGVYLWTNKSCWSHVDLRPLPDDYEPTMVSLPGTSTELVTVSDVDTEEPMEVDEKPFEDYVSPAQISEDLVTLAGLPSSRWLNLLHIDTIKQRNKPTEAPTKPKEAPFFIPTVAGLSFQFGQPSQEESSSISKVKSVSPLMDLTELGEDLVQERYDVAMNQLMKMTPSQIDAEVKGLDPDIGGSREAQIGFLKMLLIMFQKHRNVEAAVGYLAIFQKVHGDFLINDEEVAELSIELTEAFRCAWNPLRTHFDRIISVISYLKNPGFLNW